MFRRRTACTRLWVTATARRSRQGSSPPSPWTLHVRMISEQAAHHIHPGLSRKLIWLLSSLWGRLIKIQCQRLQLEHRDTSNKTSVTSPSELFVNIFYYKKLSTLSDLGLIQQICYLFKFVENLPLFKIFVGSFSIFIPTVLLHLR